MSKETISAATSMPKTCLLTITLVPGNMTTNAQSQRFRETINQEKWTAIHSGREDVVNSWNC